jgi:hypothetical protein
VQKGVTGVCKTKNEKGYNNSFLSFFLYGLREKGRDSNNSNNNGSNNSINK